MIQRLFDALGGAGVLCLVFAVGYSLWTLPVLMSYTPVTAVVVDVRPGVLFVVHPKVKLEYWEHSWRRVAMLDELWPTREWQRGDRLDVVVSRGGSFGCIRNPGCAVRRAVFKPSRDLIFASFAAGVILIATGALSPSRTGRQTSGGIPHEPPHRPPGG